MLLNEGFIICEIASRGSSTRRQICSRCCGASSQTEITRLCVLRHVMPVACCLVFLNSDTALKVRAVLVRIKRETAQRHAKQVPCSQIGSTATVHPFLLSLAMEGDERFIECTFRRRSIIGTIIGNTVSEQEAMKMQIWVDADACPGVVKDILFRAAERKKILLTLVANQAIHVPRSPFIKTVQVASGFDVADDEIVSRCNPGDLVITADIPLAAEVMEKGAMALNPRGELYSVQTIKQKLSMRDFMETMRSSGVQTGGPPPLNQSDRRAFANQLDKVLARSI